MAQSNNMNLLISKSRLITAWTFSNIVAGSDSTTSMLQTIWSFLLTNPASMSRLYTEIAQQTRDHMASGGRFPQWADVGSLPYLDACINEALRLQPPFALHLERKIPYEGLVLDGQYVPGGTVVGMSPYVVNRHRSTFGDDADEWRPERWLVGTESRRIMEQSMLTVSPVQTNPTPDHS